jgi:predicted RNA-binding Zn-ribbon protein involved in translation (DUF1610 family)
MGDSESVLCPECGWTGTADELVSEDGSYECPVCAETVEFLT